MVGWNTDAQFADTVDEDYLFANQKIRDFLRSRSYGQFILVASKGMGKTLLMRHKRKKIERDEHGFILIPQNEISDYVKLPSSPPQDLTSSMRSNLFWSDLWQIAISISMLTYFPHRITEEEKKSVLKDLTECPLPQELREQLMAAFSGGFKKEMRPSAVLDHLFQAGKKGIEKLRAKGTNTIWALFLRHINSGCVAFIDSFDQELSSRFGNDLEIWCAAQCGLLRAAWEISRHNRHTKVYVTIRQEAYASFPDAESANIRGSILLLEYSKNDLKEIFSNAVRYYENGSTISEFLGIEKIYNGYLRLHEDAFDYIHRHCIGIPRWLMLLGSDLSNAREERGLIRHEIKRKNQQRIVTEIVNRVSADTLADDYLKHEMSLFFGGGHPEYMIDKLLAKVNSTVLSFSNLSRISHKYVGEKNAEKIPGTDHPFCLLYNIGLLGIVGKSANTSHRKQIFKKPYEFDWNYDEVLPRNPEAYYLVHPSLHHMIQKKNHLFRFNKIRIGDGLEWGKEEDKRVREETLRLFISYAHADAITVEKIALAIEEYLNVKSVLHDIWLDRWRLKSGKWIQDQLFEGISKSDFLILAISKSSLGSNAVTAEWKTKFNEKLSAGSDTVFPFIIDDTRPEDMPQFLNQIFSYKYLEDQGKIHRLVDDILFWGSEKSKTRK